LPLYFKISLILLLITILQFSYYSKNHKINTEYTSKSLTNSIQTIPIVLKKKNLTNNEINFITKTKINGIIITIQSMITGTFIENNTDFQTIVKISIPKLSINNTFNFSFN
jgi:hypothetical protein